MSTTKKTVLENGVRVVTDRMPGSRAVSIGLIVDTEGCSDRGQSGLPHLCEHLLFQGTSNRSALEIARLMDGAGGRFGGFTGRDYTCYYAVVLAEHAPYALDLLGDIVLNPIFAPTALAGEQNAIVCEIEVAADDPHHLAHSLVKARAWSGHALGSSITGSIQEVRSFTREDLIYFVHDNYTAERLIVAAAGNVDHDDFVAQVRDAFWRLPRSEAPRTEAGAPTWRSSVELEAKAVSQAYFALAVEAPPYAHPERYEAHALNQMLGGGISSRLYRRLREERGLVYEIASSLQAYRAAGMLMIEGSSPARHLVEVLKVALDELRILMSAQPQIDEEELQRTRAQLRAQIVLTADDSHSRMSRLATQELYFRRAIPEQELLRRIDQLDCHRLRELAGSALTKAAAQPAVGVVARLEELTASADELEGLVGQQYSECIPQPPKASTGPLSQVHA